MACMIEWSEVDRQWVTRHTMLSICIVEGIIQRQKIVFNLHITNIPIASIWGSAIDSIRCVWDRSGLNLQWQISKRKKFFLIENSYNGFKQDTSPTLESKSTSIIMVVSVIITLCVTIIIIIPKAFCRFVWFKFSRFSILNALNVVCWNDRCLQRPDLLR